MMGFAQIRGGREDGENGGRGTLPEGATISEAQHATGARGPSEQSQELHPAWRAGPKTSPVDRQADADCEGQEGKIRDVSGPERSRRERATRTQPHKQGFFPEGQGEGGGETGIWKGENRRVDAVKRVYIYYQLARQNKSEDEAVSKRSRCLHRTFVNQIPSNSSDHRALLYWLALL